MKIISKIYGKIFLHHFCDYRRSKLKNVDFSIISNNCWGGIVYQYYGIKYLSPTVGMYFYSDEYIKFLSNLKYYLGCELKINTVNFSKYKNDLIKKGQDNVLIGMLDDVEIVLLHYKDASEAAEKWNRRVKRLNFDKLIVKFNDQNLGTYENLKKFDDMEFNNKICFTSKKYDSIHSGVYMKMFKRCDYVKDDTTLYNFSRYIDLKKYINNIK